MCVEGEECWMDGWRRAERESIGKYEVGGGCERWVYVVYMRRCVCVCVEVRWLEEGMVVREGKEIWSGRMKGKLIREETKELQGWREIGIER